VGQILNETYQLLVYADYVNLLGDNTGTINRNTKLLTVASNVVGLEVNAKKTKYIVTCMVVLATKRRVLVRMIGFISS
jgi:hypothetical protein